MIRILVISLVAAALTMPAHAEVSLFKGVIGNAVENAVNKATEPDRPVNCRPICGRPQNNERCKMV